ncbi:hypothetical protein KAS50_06825 [bacterium]|nr:hypothetical protein [bacterium]
MFRIILNIDYYIHAYLCFLARLLCTVSEKTYSGINDFRYFGTDEVITRGNYSVRGLALPREVLYKIFYRNAVKWIPVINKDY